MGTVCGLVCRSSSDARLVTAPSAADAAAGRGARKHRCRCPPAAALKGAAARSRVARSPSLGPISCAAPGMLPAPRGGVLY